MNVHIGEWLRARNRYAHDLPDYHVREFFLDILPDDLRTEIIRRKDIVTLQQMISFAQEEISRLNDKRLAAMHDQKRNELLGSKHEAFAGAVVADETKKLLAEI